MKTNLLYCRRRTFLKRTLSWRAPLRTLRLILSTGLLLAAIALLAFVFQISNSRSQVVSAQQQPSYAQQKSQAEKLFVDGSYARAHDVYAQISKAGLAPEDIRWVDFRLADTEWRAQAATETSDTTKFEEAQKHL